LPIHVSPLVFHSLQLNNGDLGGATAGRMCHHQFFELLDRDFENSVIDGLSTNRSRAALSESVWERLKS
jgi:hypothetical protein